MSELKFHPHIAGLIKAAQEADAPPLSEMTAEEARAARNPVITDHLGPAREMARVEDFQVPVDGTEITVRVFTPEGRGPFPILVYFHGGGWVVGNIDTHDSLCRNLAGEAGCMVAAVDYRLAPENKYPVPLNDCYAATCWVADRAAELGGDPARLAVGGDSCGGGLAASVCLRARDESGPEIGFQLLVYPVTDLSDMDKETYRFYADKLILTLDGMKYFRGSYLRSDEDGLETLASPLLAEDLTGLPPALVMVAEHDVLTSDGELYAKRLKEAGVPTTYSVYPGLIHLFFGMAALGMEGSGVIEAAEAIRKAF